MTLAMPMTAALSGSGVSPLSLPGSANLESWHYAGRGLTLGATLKRSGTTPPADMVITSGSRQQSIGLKITTGAGALGVATYSAYLDGGVTPFQTGTTAASVVLTAIGLTVSMPAGTYSSDNVYEGVVESWANLTTKTRTLASVGAVSAQPTLLWQAQNNRPAVRSDGGSTGFMSDTSSDWASQVASGNDSDFTLFLVAKTESAVPTSINVWLGFGHSVNADATYFVGTRNGTNLHRTNKIDDAASAAAVDGGALTTNYRVITVIQHGTTVDLRIDGTAVYTGSAQNVGVTTLDTVAVFALLRGGAATNSLVGSIGEMITYNTALSSADALVVEQYLRSGWAI